MSFDFAKFLELAEELSKRTDPAALRTAISRAYYAAYHHGRWYLTRYSVNVPATGEGHRIVWEQLGRPERNKDEKSAAEAGERLKEMRTEADYRPHANPVKYDADAAIGRARKVLKLGRGSST